MADKVDPRTGELTTANYGWVKPTVGASIDAWGGYINTDLDGIDSTVHSIQTSVPAASSTTPAMDGTAAVGTGTTFARADHVHPTDTSRAAASALAGYLPLAGTTTNDNANAGVIGEVISSVVTTGVPLTSVTNANITSISLTPGDWDVYGEIWISLPSGGQSMVGGINTVSAAMPNPVAMNVSRVQVLVAITAGLNSLTLVCRASLATTTTYYLVTQASFSAGSPTVTGKLWARRAR